MQYLGDGMGYFGFHTGIIVWLKQHWRAVFLVGYPALCFVPVYLAKRRGEPDTMKWWIISSYLTPIVTSAYILSQPRISPNQDQRRVEDVTTSPITDG